MMAPNVSILGLHLRYPHLRPVYAILEAGEKGTREMMREDGHTGDLDEVVHEISGVNFAEDLTPLIDEPITTNSDTNKFAMLVWRMLDACQSGGMGGDACRMDDVLDAAVRVYHSPFSQLPK